MFFFFFFSGVRIGSLPPPYMFVDKLTGKAFRCLKDIFLLTPFFFKLGSSQKLSNKKKKELCQKVLMPHPRTEGRKWRQRDTI